MCEATAQPGFGESVNVWVSVHRTMCGVVSRPVRFGIGEEMVRCRMSDVGREHVEETPLTPRAALGEDIHIESGFLELTAPLVGNTEAQWRDCRGGSGPHDTVEFGIWDR